MIWENSANHISIFLTWIINNDLLSKIHDENKEDILKVKARKMIGYEFLAKNYDMVLSREDLLKKSLNLLIIFMKIISICIVISLRIIHIKKFLVLVFHGMIMMKYRQISLNQIIKLI